MWTFLAGLLPGSGSRQSRAAGPATGKARRGPKPTGRAAAGKVLSGCGCLCVALVAFCALALLLDTLFGGAGRIGLLFGWMFCGVPVVVLAGLVVWGVGRGK